MSMPTFKTISILFIASSIMALVGCASSADQAFDSQTELNERKMQVAKDYEKCVKKSTTEEEQSKCEALLKAAEALQ